MSENVALWKLYAEKKGYILDLKQAHIKKIVKKEDVAVEIGDIHNKKSSFRTLSEDQYKIELIDIIYYDQCDKNDHDQDSDYRIKHSDNPRHYVNKKVIDNIKNGYLRKRIPWSFEKEARLIVKVSSILVKETDNSIRIRIPDSIYDDLEGRLIASPLGGYDDIFTNSSLSDDIEWNDT